MECVFADVFGKPVSSEGSLFYLRGVFLLCLVFSSVAYFKLGLCGLIYLSVVCSDSTCNQFQTQSKALVSLLSISGVGMNFLLICRNSMGLAQIWGLLLLLI